MLMTITEAEEILDIVSAALQDTGHRRHPVSALQGYDLHQICTAPKLRIANERLQLAHRPDFEEQFAKELELYGGIPWLIMMSFVADDEVDNLTAPGVFNPIDSSTLVFKERRLAGMETASSFGECCKNLGRTTRATGTKSLLELILTQGRVLGRRREMGIGR